MNLERPDDDIDLEIKKMELAGHLGDGVLTTSMLIEKFGFSFVKSFVEEDFFDFDDSVTRKQMRDKTKNTSVLTFLLPLRNNLKRKKIKYPTFKRYDRYESYFKSEFPEKEYPELWI